MEDIWTYYLYYEERQYDEDGTLLFIHKRATEQEGKEWHCDECRQSMTRTQKVHHLSANNHSHKRHSEAFKQNREFKFASHETFVKELAVLFVRKKIPVSSYEELSLFLTKYTGRYQPSSKKFRSMIDIELNKLPKGKKARVEARMFVTGDRLPADKFPRQSHLKKVIQKVTKEKERIEEAFEDKVTDHKKMLMRAEDKYLKKRELLEKNKEKSLNSTFEPNTKKRRITKRKGSETVQESDDQSSDFDSSENDSSDDSSSDDEASEDDDYETAHSQHSENNTQTSKTTINLEYPDVEFEQDLDLSERDFLLEASPDPPISSNSSRNPTPKPYDSPNSISSSSSPELIVID